MVRHNKFSRRTVLVAATTALLSIAALAQDKEINWLTAPAAVTVGQPISVSVGTNQSTMAVRVTSDPPGLVDQTVTVNGGTGTFVVGTNSGAPQGNYHLVATPVGGGGAKTRLIIAAPSE